MVRKGNAKKESTFALQQTRLPCSDYITDYELDQLGNELPTSGRMYPDLPLRNPL